MIDIIKTFYSINILNKNTEPAPSEGCQMVPKGCQFTIPWALIGTPLKVQE